ncbi:hypothetical protein C464_08170 [Halorubrum coriense DSM 10284]|uniref:Uncharacterized protein n=1 Tax=Halorubrum coriense DSM 10284 TaxID=1227466 RepID=M0ELW2_9EURY|nr:DUF6610 family protein [Halorubrum coriense]ELZ47882.1 hypothetical protein C464_08170 [Halorubrum coriense DSM 10284]
MTLDVFATVNGGSEASEAVKRSDAQLGIESQNQHQIKSEGIEFVDYPFSKEDQSFDEHCETVAGIEPAVTVAPDIERGRDAQDVYEQARELSDFADEVIVVPKSIHPGDVPEQWRVGLPLASFGSDDEHQITDYHGCDSIHLLGGSPITQLRAIKILHDRVDSADGAAVFKGASMGDVFAPTQFGPHTRDRRCWFDTGDDVGYYERVEASLTNVHDALNNPGSAYSLDYDRPGESAQSRHPAQTQLVF